MSFQPDMKLFEAPLEHVPDHVKIKNLELVKNKWISIGDYDAKILYAVTGDLKDDKKARRVLRAEETEFSDDASQSFVWQREGTMTAWWSKVRDILNSTWVTAPWRVEKIIHHTFDTTDENVHQKIWTSWHDRMTEQSVKNTRQVWDLFKMWEKSFLQHIDISEWTETMSKWSKIVGANLSNDQINFLYSLFKGKWRNPTDMELFAYAQANSEHCFHGTFNGIHILNGVAQEKTLFQRIRNTHAHNPNHTLSAYYDNASASYWGEAIIYIESARWVMMPVTKEIVDLLKVESHNHPSFIEPEQWTATWVWGLKRDLESVENWSKATAAWVSYFTSHTDGNLNPVPDEYASARHIMLNGPIWWASYANEFGVPVIYGDARVFDQKIWWTHWGFNKPIVLAWWTGIALREWKTFQEGIRKEKLEVWTQIIQLGWPGMKIGVGWWSGSSVEWWSQDANLDFNSVQRWNAEMQRRCSMVIEKCMKMWEDNPLIAVHDVWAWGDGNAIQEFVKDSGKWATIDLSKIPVSDPSMSPLEIWSNESQERFILGIHPDKIHIFKKMCEIENAPFAIVGEIEEWTQFKVINKPTWEVVMDMDMEELLWKNVPVQLHDNSVKIDGGILDIDSMELSASIRKVLSHPTVADKSVYITIWDRTVQWKTVQDQMVWSWQVPVSNVWVTLLWMEWKIWKAITTGERAPLAVVNPAASVRMAIGESITNLFAANIADFKSMEISGNWMAARNHPWQLVALDEWVQAAEVLCIDLGIAIPVGKDSLSMKSISKTWEEVVSPLSFVSSIHANTPDAYKTLTPELQRVEMSELFLIDLWEWRNRMAGSMLAQVWDQFWNETPDVDNPEILLSFMKAMKELHKEWILLAYHDRWDGWLFTTLSEMSFASHIWVDIDLTSISWDSQQDFMKALFSEELGAVIQVESSKVGVLRMILEKYGLINIVSKIGQPNLEKQNISVSNKWELKINETRVDLQRTWSEDGYKKRCDRENPETAKQEFDRILNENELPIPKKLTFDVSKHPAHDIIKEYENTMKPKPRVALLRSQWTNGQDEMMRYFTRCWFDVVNVHINHLKSWEYNLKDFTGIAIPGGFSFGDVLWAGAGFARMIEENPLIKEQLETFEWFKIGVCNGCQVLSQLEDIIGNWEKFPRFERNDSAMFEARISPITIKEKPDSIFLRWMGWSVLPIISSHAEGKSVWGNVEASAMYADHTWTPTNTYPHNPNGSKWGATGYEIGNTYFMMGHPEREPREDSPWLQIPLNLRQWVEEQKTAWILNF